MSEAQRLLQTGDAERALSLLQSALSRDPAHPGAWALLGQAFERLGNRGNAVAAFQRALSLDPELWPVWQALGMLWLRDEDHERAAMAFRRVTEGQPDNAQAWYGLGVALLRAERPAEAVDPLRQAVTRQPDWPQALVALGVALLESDRVEEAGDPITRAATLSPDDAEVRLAEARLLAARGERAAAVEALRALTETHADLADAWARLGELYLTFEDPERRARATAALRRARELVPESTELHRKLIEAYWELGFNEDVERELDILLDRHSDYAPGWAVLGNYHLSRGQDAEALAAYERALQLRPDWPVVLFRRAETLEHLQRLEEARQAFRAALGADPDQANAAIGIARTSLSLGDPGETLEALERVAPAPGSSEVHRLRGKALLQLERLQEARTQLRTAVERDDGDREAWVALARVLERLGDPAAGDALARARELSRNEPTDRRGMVAEGVEQRGEHFLFRARVYLEEGRPREALRYLRQAAPFFPDRPELLELRARAEAEAGLRLGPFVDVAADSRVVQVNRSGTLEKRYIVETTGSGAAWLDYDRDGRVDIYLANGHGVHYVPLEGGGTTIESTERPPDALLRQEPEHLFTDVAGRAGTADRGWAGGVAVGDLDNDGWPDLYLTHYGSNRLYRNNGDGTYTDITAAAGADDPRWSSSAAFADLDGDGFLDLYVANYTVFDPASPPYEGKELCHFMGIPTMCGPAGMEGQTDLLLWSDGGLRFEAVDQRQIADLAYYGLGVHPFDADGDGRLDLFVANDLTPNLLLVNQGDRELSEEALLYGLAYTGDGRLQAGMGIASGDLNGDRLPELILTNFSHDTNTVYRNTGAALYEDITQTVGFGTTTFSYLGWGVQLRDFDLDGDLDAFVANGHVYPEVDRHDLGTSYRQRNQAFANVDGRLVEVTDTAGPGLEVVESSRAAVIADYDGDGDEDVLVSNIDAAPTLLRNDRESQRLPLQVRLVGRDGNRDAIGARVTVEAGDRTWTHEVQTSAGYMGSNDPTLTFGLGSSPRVDLLRVRWPSGRVEELTGVRPGERLLVVEGRGVVARRSLTPDRRP